MFKISLPEAQNHAELAEQFGMLSDPTRLQILGLLSMEDTSVSDVCEQLKLRQPTASHHLGLLRAMGLVDRERRGKSVIYSITVPSGGAKVSISL